MKEIQPLESMFDKVTKSRLPNWAKTFIAIAIALTPLIEVLSRWFLIKQVADLVEQLFG